MILNAKNVGSSTTGKSELSDLSALRGLGRPLLTELEAICKTSVFQSGQTVLVESVTPEYVGYVKQGILRMQKTLTDGRQQIVGLLIKGDLFGYAIGQSKGFVIEAAGEASVCMFASNQFNALSTRFPELERFLLQNTLNELDRARDWMIILTSYKINVRLAGFLVVLCTRYVDFDNVLRVSPGRLELKIPVARADLSNLLGARGESISRAFSALAKKGIIKVKTPYHIEILDIGRLFDEAGNEDTESLDALNRLMRIKPQRYSTR